ncbi:hypothetical protein AAHH17_12590 [Lysinibacillus capsici]|uniref:hypothetical protein n=1 Tax=Lysinibacillus capsici TaxID=2115968 RepID=UPI0032E4FB4A
MLYIYEAGNIVYDEDSLNDEDKEQAVVVTEALPIPETIDGKYAVLRVDTVNKALYYDYYDYYDAVPTGQETQKAPPTVEEMQAQTLINTEYLIAMNEMGIQGGNV